jgi:hypothetical protein
MAVKLSNNATSTLSAAIAANETAMTVQVNDAALFPDLGVGDWFPATLVNATGAMEIVRVTGRNGAIFTVQRGQEGTTAKDFPVGSKVDLRLTTAALLDLVTIAVGQVVGLDDRLAELNDGLVGVNKGLAAKLSKSGDTMTARLNIVSGDLNPLYLKNTDPDGDARIVVTAANGTKSYAELGHRSNGDAYVWVNGSQWTFKPGGGFYSPNYIFSGGDIRASGRVYAKDRVVVGEDQTASWIEMRDTDNGTRYIHNNEGNIGFLDSSMAWSFRVRDDGAVWTKGYGWLSDRFADRGAVCQWGTAIAEFGGYDSGISQSVGQCPAPYVMVGLRRDYAGSNGISYIRAVQIRNT